MQIVILAAEENSKSFIRTSLQQATVLTHTPIVVCLLDLYNDLKHHTPKDVHPIRVPVRYRQQGRAMSLLTAAGVLRDDAPLLVLNCEVGLPLPTLRAFEEAVLAAFAKGAQSAMLCFKAEGAAIDSCSYVNLDAKGNAAQVVQGTKISDLASCEVHAFASWEVARRAVYEMVILGTKTDGKFYLAPAHNNLQYTVVELVDLGARK